MKKLENPDISIDDLVVETQNKVKEVKEEIKRKEQKKKQERILRRLIKKRIMTLKIRIKATEISVAFYVI
ncbi:MAG: hypothetical protein ACLRWM_06155 [Streptococcus sp.]